MATAGGALRQLVRGVPVSSAGFVTRRGYQGLARYPATAAASWQVAVPYQRFINQVGGLVDGVPLSKALGARQQLVARVYATSTTTQVPAAEPLKVDDKEEAVDVAHNNKISTQTSYWSIKGTEFKKEDGTPWQWRSFTPAQAYEADLSIDLRKHHEPVDWRDRVAYWTVKFMRIPTDLFFRKRYGCRAMMLETVAAVPGMVGGALLHLKSLRRFEHSGGWIRTLLEEAENERMHLMTFMIISQPKWYERALVIATQGVFFNLYFVMYLVAPRVAHRVVGYLEEEAIISYTSFLKEIDAGRIENIPAPQLAIDYWKLKADAKLRDVVVAVRADEAHHRDVNHYAADLHFTKRKLREVPAPINYH
eukprot:jgi/Chlat1/8776/Chrsp90S08130